MAFFKLTPKAYQALKDIGAYSERRWGKEKRNAYLQKLDKRFTWLAENPSYGHARNDVGSGYFSFREGKHLIFYTIHHKHINIIGIPHTSMDVISYLY